ncbi:MAG: folate-binding protein [Polaromonas sp.]|nr:folate-binding protein [Polaromonas sp.]
MTALAQLGLIRVAGEDAVKFLQGQLTQDVALMGLPEARLAAFCNAKGRMQASFIAFKHDEQDILLVCSQDLLAQTLKRLSMFVLRAKVKITDATGEFQLLGIAGAAVEKMVAGSAQPWAALDLGQARLVLLPASAGVARAVWCAPAGTAPPDCPTLAPGLWEWLDVQSGIAMVTQPIYEAFVPQMLNYESVGGVNFKKGCYPGQEVVARSQFRGTLKRRAYVAHCPAAASVGQEVFHASDALQPCGLVAASASNPTGGFDLIVSMQTAAAADASGGKLTVGSATGAALEMLPLPYALLEDI